MAENTKSYQMVSKKAMVDAVGFSLTDPLEYLNIGNVLYISNLVINATHFNADLVNRG